LSRAVPVVIDTNVLVRLATGDHAHQHARAQALFAAEPVRVLLTVVLETEWVLRSRYGYAPEQFASFVHWLLASPGVAVEDADAVEHRHGLRPRDDRSPSLRGGRRPTRQSSSGASIANGGV
jgi:predicted nucleic acid-binding protein